MTRQQLLKNKRFLTFCSIEYGVELSELREMPLYSLVKYLVEWFKAPEILSGLYGVQRDKVRQVIEQRALSE